MSESDDPAGTNILEPEAQTADDSGVDDIVDIASSTQSLSSSILRYRVENGRRYTTYGSGEYLLPNDGDEQQRLDITHQIWILVNADKLYQTPPQKWKRILDVGTGTGIWAMEAADEHPEAEVIGVDLSPIQPTMVTPNCTFEIDDLEDEWTFKQPFDFIFIRSMIVSFKSWPDFFSKVFNNLEPGGYVEVQDILYPLASDDSTTHNTDILAWSELMVKAANNIGRSITVASEFKSMLEDAGFVDIVEIREKIPINRWPKRSGYKDLGIWSHHMLHSSLEGISMGLLTRHGLTAEEVDVLLAKVRRDLSRTKIHGYWHTYLVYARKPGNVAD